MHATLPAGKVTFATAYKYSSLFKQVESWSMRIDPLITHELWLLYYC